MVYLILNLYVIHIYIYIQVIGICTREKITEKKRKKEKE